MANDIQPAAQAPDFYIENQPGAPFRAELNTIIAALVSSNAGPTEPENPQEGWLWLDTSETPWTLYRRNADNTAWIKSYDAQNRPTKSEVGLGNVPNYTATSSITDDADNKFATAKAVSTLNNNKLEKSGIAADSAKLGDVAAASYALQTGNYSGLRAQATTKGDVGLGNVPNHGISDATNNNSSTTFASSKAVFDLNQAKLGKSEQAANSALLNGKADTAFATKTHSHGASDLPTGTTSAVGLVQLNDSTGSNSTTVAATANAVRKAKAEAISGGVPPGIITMFAGTEPQIPTGWKLCNGSGETSNGIKVPDLRSRFIVGAGTTYDPGQTGGGASATTSNNGEHSHSVTVNKGGEHNHTVEVKFYTLGLHQTASHNHLIAGNSRGGADGDSILRKATGLHAGPWCASEFAGGSEPHTHNAEIIKTEPETHDHSASSGSAGGHTHTVSTLPPYYALAYIIKL